MKLRIARITGGNDAGMLQYRGANPHVYARRMLHFMFPCPALGIDMFSWRMDSEIELRGAWGYLYEHYTDLAVS